MWRAGISNETSNVLSHESGVVKKRLSAASSSSHYSSSYSCGSRGHIPSPVIGQRVRIDDITVYMREAKVSRVISFLSTCYSVILLLLGFIFPLFKVTYRLGKSYALEGFYVYLFGLGILFLIYAYTNVLKDHYASKRERRQLQTQAITVPGMNSYGRRRSLHNDTAPMVGSLLLRIFTVLFCIGSVVDNSLKFGVHITTSCNRMHVLNVIQPLAQTVFMLLECYFIFNNAGMGVRQYPIVAKFGIMHLMCANLCVWMAATINKTADQFHASRLYSQYNASANAVTGIYLPLYICLLLINPQLVRLYFTSQSIIVTTDDSFPLLQADAAAGCTQNLMLTKLATEAKPYLFSCTSQFCILASCVLYAMWKQVDTDTDTQCSDCREHMKRANLSTTRTIDCGNTSRGLLTGILTLLGVISSLIAFFMLTTTDYKNLIATLFVQNYQIAMYLTMTVVAVVVLLKLRALDFNSCRSTIMEDMLLIICTAALFTYDIIGIIASLYSINKLKAILLLATSISRLLQSVIQMSAIMMGLKLCVPDIKGVSPQNKKPGRECVTFLAAANISLWILSLFSNVTSQGFEIQLLMLGQAPWSVVSNVAGPFVTFYHLFSASCLIDIWYNAYRLPSPPPAEL